MFCEKGFPKMSLPETVTDLQPEVRGSLRTPLAQPGFAPVDMFSLDGNAAICLPMSGRPSRLSASMSAAQWNGDGIVTASKWQGAMFNIAGLRGYANTKVVSFRSGSEPRTEPNCPRIARQSKKATVAENGITTREPLGVSWLIPQELENLTLDYRGLRTAYRVHRDISVASIPFA